MDGIDLEHGIETCDTYAIKKDEIPLWQEYIRSSFVFIENSNIRMAFLSAFAALDCCIEKAYASLYDSFNAVCLYLGNDIEANAKAF